MRRTALAELGQASNAEQLEAWRVAHLGRRGSLSEVLRAVARQPQELRRAFGAAANQLKGDLERAFEERRQALEATQLAAALERERVDVTLPGRRPRRGPLHPTTRILGEILGYFRSVGFHVVEGPEVEYDAYNFELLNIPRDHPARDQWDTIWITDDVVLRTHTSPNQVRVMERTRPPVRVVVPGKCYRYEATDASHESIFYQVEGLLVDDRTTMADLKGVLTGFARHMFGPERRARFRCDFFPFVEPGVDFAMDCMICGGAGCRVCKFEGWIEIMGAGMVHPQVLRWVGYDPEVYTGWAFGLGPERIAMLKYGIDDIRLFYQNDLRFLRQFGLLGLSA